MSRICRLSVDRGWSHVARLTARSSVASGKDSLLGALKSCGEDEITAVKNALLPFFFISFSLTILYCYFLFKHSNIGYIHNNRPIMEKVEKQGEDDAQLATLGHKAELNRNFSTL